MHRVWALKAIDRILMKGRTKPMKMCGVSAGGHDAVTRTGQCIDSVQFQSKPSKS